jgi:hypothetical protein
LLIIKYCKQKDDCRKISACAVIGKFIMDCI